MRPTVRARSRTARNFAVTRAAVIAVCALIVAAGGALLIGRLRSTHQSEIQTQRAEAQQGRLVIVTDAGATCQNLSFDNRTGQIVNLHTGPCADAAQGLDADTPLGSIRKALNRR